MNKGAWLDIGVVLTGVLGGVASGLFGIGGGTIMVPVLGLLLGFSQHRAQGTSLVALIPPTGLLAVLEYGKAGYVDWRVGLLLIPGVFLGGIVGGKIARALSAAKMRKVFAGLIFLMGMYEITTAWRH